MSSTTPLPSGPRWAPPPLPALPTCLVLESHVELHVPLPFALPRLARWTTYVGPGPAPDLHWDQATRFDERRLSTRSHRNSPYGDIETEKWFEWLTSMTWRSIARDSQGGQVVGYTEQTDVYEPLASGFRWTTHLRSWDARRPHARTDPETLASLQRTVLQSMAAHASELEKAYSKEPHR